MNRRDAIKTLLAYVVMTHEAGREPERAAAVAAPTPSPRRDRYIPKTARTGLMLKELCRFGTVLAGNDLVYVLTPSRYNIWRDFDANTLTIHDAEGRLWGELIGLGTPRLRIVTYSPLMERGVVTDETCEFTEAELRMAAVGAEQPLQWSFDRRVAGEEMVDA